MLKNELSIIVPAYNEEETLAEMIQQLVTDANKLNIPYEILIVDDASKDKTGLIAEELNKKFNMIEVIHNERNEMIGGAITSGIKQCRYSNIIISPVDSPIDEKYIRKFLTAGSEADIVCGYRPKRKGYTLCMDILSRLYRMSLLLILGVSFRDFTWICLYKKRIFDTIHPKFKGIAFFPEVLVKAYRKNYIIKEIECEMKERRSGKATVSRISRIIHLFFETLRLWKEINLGKW